MHPWLKAEIYHCFRPVVFFQASNWVNLAAQGHTFYLQKVAHDFRRPFSRTVFFYAFSSSTIIYLNNLVYLVCLLITISFSTGYFPLVICLELENFSI